MLIIRYEKDNAGNILVAERLFGCNFTVPSGSIMVRSFYEFDGILQGFTLIGPSDGSRHFYNRENPDPVTLTPIPKRLPEGIHAPALRFSSMSAVEAYRTDGSEAAYTMKWAIYWRNFIPTYPEIPTDVKPLIEIDSLPDFLRDPIIIESVDAQAAREPPTDSAWMAAYVSEQGRAIHRSSKSFADPLNEVWSDMRTDLETLVENKVGKGMPSRRQKHIGKYRAGEKAPTNRTFSYSKSRKKK